MLPIVCLCVCVCVCHLVALWTFTHVISQDTWGDWAWIYYVTLVLIGSFVILNLVLAVINENFVAQLEDAGSLPHTDSRVSIPNDESQRLSEVEPGLSLLRGG